MAPPSLSGFETGTARIRAVTKFFPQRYWCLPCSWHDLRLTFQTSCHYWLSDAFCSFVFDFCLNFYTVLNDFWNMMFGSYVFISIRLLFVLLLWLCPSALFSLSACMFCCSSVSVSGSDYVRLWNRLPATSSRRRRVTTTVIGFLNLSVCISFT